MKIYAPLLAAILITAAHGGQPTLAWDAGTGGSLPARYSVEIKGDDGTWAEIAEVAATNPGEAPPTEIPWPEIPPAGATVRVIAYNQQGVPSLPSNELVVEPAAARAINLRIKINVEVTIEGISPG